MTCFTVIGDPHAKPDNLDKINTLFDIIEDVGNSAIWLGDLLDTKEVVRGKCLNTYIERFNKSKLNHYVLVGNHDFFNLECRDHALQALKCISNVTVVDRLFWFTDDITMVPYIHDIKQFKQILEDTAGCRTLFCHADIKGFDYGNGRISEEGLASEDFDGLRNVISGHYHKYQQVGNITYLGTPFSHSFGESNQTKYIAEFDTQTGKLNLIETPFPKHVTLDFTIGVSNTPVMDPTNYNRVLLKGTQEQINKVLRVNGVKYIEQPTDTGSSSVITEADSTEIQFLKWGAEIKGYSEELLFLGLEILNNV